MDFHNLIKPMAEKPKSQATRSQAFTLIMIRDQLTIQSWLCVGAILQTALILILPFHYAILPPILLLTLHITDTLLISFNLKRNPLLDDVLPTKYSAQVPSPDGSYGSSPASQSIVVFLLGAKVNHPAGMLAPDMAQLGTYATRMYAEIEAADPTEYGLLGQSTMTNNDRGSKNEHVQLMYFRDVEGLHRYAHGPLHREAWDWFNRTAKQHPYMSIWHETYVVPAANWETVYIQSAPTALGAARVQRMGALGDGEEGAEKKMGKEGEWLSTIVDARKGAMKTASGRMAKSEGREHDNYLQAEYQDVNVA